MRNAWRSAIGRLPLAREMFAADPPSLLQILRNENDKIEARLANYVATDPGLLPVGTQARRRGADEQQAGDRSRAAQGRAAVRGAAAHGAATGRRAKDHRFRSQPRRQRRPGRLRRRHRGTGFAQGHRQTCQATGQEQQACSPASGKPNLPIPLRARHCRNNHIRKHELTICISPASNFRTCQGKASPWEPRC